MQLHKDYVTTADCLQSTVADSLICDYEWHKSGQEEVKVNKHHWEETNILFND